MDMPAPDSDIASDADEASDPAVLRAERRLSSCLRKSPRSAWSCSDPEASACRDREGGQGPRPGRRLRAPVARHPPDAQPGGQDRSGAARSEGRDCAGPRRGDRTRLAKRERKAAAKDAETRKHKVWEAVFEVAEVEIEPGEDFDNLMEALGRAPEVNCAMPTAASGPCARPPSACSRTSCSTPT